MEKYYVSIIKENKKLTGTLNFVMNFKINNNGTKRANSFNKRIDFIPASVLCDLSSFILDNKKDDNDVIVTYGTERAFKNLIIDKSSDTYYFVFSEYIKNRILSNDIPNLKELEKIRVYYNLKLDYTISYKKKNDKKGINQYKKCNEEYIPLQFGFSNVEEIDNKESYKYVYNCSNLTEVLFAILHCLVMNKYNKIKKCNHCGGLFFYNHEKYKYCQRKSPYEKYTHLDCEQAVRNIKQYFFRIHKRIYNNFYNYYRDKLNNYMNEYYIYKEKIDECSSIDNLKEMENYLKSVYKKN